MFLPNTIFLSFILNFFTLALVGVWVEVPNNSNHVNDNGYWLLNTCLHELTTGLIALRVLFLILINHTK